jgi:hypothetical protein
MSGQPQTTTFVSRGRLRGVVRQRPDRAPGGSPGPEGPGELDTQAWEAVHYRARLILGDAIAPPPYLRARRG